MTNGKERRGNEGKDSPRQQEEPILFRLAWLAAFSACLYGLIAFLSSQFDNNVASTKRPILVALLLFALAFAVYLYAVRLVSRTKDSQRTLCLIIVSSILFRVLLLFSVPIQEIDIYRYIWDGAVLAAGVNPYSFSPDQVRAEPAKNQIPEVLQTLRSLKDRKPALKEILHRIHFGELPTVYPPTSQAVFAAANLTTPEKASVMSRLVIMKAWIVAFDVATLLLLIKILRFCELPSGLCVIYAWCPLVMKEIANSGHLDSIAVFLATWSVYLTARLLRETSKLTSIQITLRMVSLVVVLALAVGAKLYPVVLAPLVFGVLARQVRLRLLVIPALVFGLSTIVVLFPMLPRNAATGTESQNVVDADDPPVLMDLEDGSLESVDPSKGLQTFLRHWEMNDFIFLILVENLNDTEQLPESRVAWFSVVPNSVRANLSQTVSRVFNVAPKDTSFIVARALTAATFLAVAIAIAWRAARIGDAMSLFEGAFLTLAWFWLLCPTQNPWYWTWAMPFLPFARGRAWLAVSGLVLIYYLRFLFQYHFPDTGTFGTRYSGVGFFDFIVTWIEYLPWFVWLAWDAYRRRS